MDRLLSHRVAARPQPRHRLLARAAPSTWLRACPDPSVCRATTQGRKRRGSHPGGLSGRSSRSAGSAAASGWFRRRNRLHRMNVTVRVAAGTRGSQNGPPTAINPRPARGVCRRGRRPSGRSTRKSPNQSVSRDPAAGCRSRKLFPLADRRWRPRRPAPADLGGGGRNGWPRPRSWSSARGFGQRGVEKPRFARPGTVYLIDLDLVEPSNLSRSVLFRAEDAGLAKAQVAARRVRELNPEIAVIPMHGDVITDLDWGFSPRLTWSSAASTTAKPGSGLTGNAGRRLRPGSTRVSRRFKES